MITIDKDIPLPSVKLGRPHKYPWTTMEVDDSFLVSQPGSKRLSLAAQGNKWARGLNIENRFTQQFGESGLRVWRIK